jgi:hypothetical protein
MQHRDETVAAEKVLELIRTIRGSGWKAQFDTRCDEEPVLAGFSLASSDKLSIQLIRLGVPVGLRQIIKTEMMTAQLVCIEAMRQAGRELWQDFLPNIEPGNQP